MTPTQIVRRTATLTHDGTERTVGLESHRCKLSTVAGADHIYVIDKGRVAETGTHAALIAGKGLYARLQSLQNASVTLEMVPISPATPGSA